ncbi:MAG: hypothetical protein U1F43_29815 [Myxococcota bacterium]
MRLCELPADCGPKGVCVGFMCRTGADQALVEVLHPVAVLPAVVSPNAAAVDREVRRLTQRLGQDLGWSGFYAVKTEADQASFSPSWLKEGASPAEVRRVSWQALGIERLVMTAVGKRPDGSFEVRIRGVDIERWSVIDLPEGKVTIAPGASETDIGAISNGWVNALVGYDTGIPASLGSRIVGSTEVKQGVKEIAFVGSDGGGWTQVTSNGSLNLQAAWGPGGKLGWMSYQTGNADWWVDECAAAIGPKKGPSCAKPFSTRPGLNAGGAWSPDGRYLALSVAETGDSEIILIDGKDGEEEARLTDHPALDTSPAWSPDGKRLAFVSDRVAQNPQIFVLSLEGGPLEQVTHEGYNAGPEWSPNGQSLLFVRQSGNDFMVMRYDFGTNDVRRLTNGKGSAESPTFSPDGRYIAYTLTIDKVSRLWVMNADGENPRAVGGEAAEKAFSSPAWERRFVVKPGK